MVLIHKILSTPQQLETQEYCNLIKAEFDRLVEQLDLKRFTTLPVLEEGLNNLNLLNTDILSFQKDFKLTQAQKLFLIKVKEKIRALKTSFSTDFGVKLESNNFFRAGMDAKKYPNLFNIKQPRILASTPEDPEVVLDTVGISCSIQEEFEELQSRFANLYKESITLPSFEKMIKDLRLLYEDIEECKECPEFSDDEIDFFNKLQVNIDSFAEAVAKNFNEKIKKDPFLKAEMSSESFPELEYSFKNIGNVCNSFEKSLQDLHKDIEESLNKLESLAILKEKMVQLNELRKTVDRYKGDLYFSADNEPGLSKVQGKIRAFGLWFGKEIARKEKAEKFYNSTLKSFQDLQKNIKESLNAGVAPGTLKEQVEPLNLLFKTVKNTQKDSGFSEKQKSALSGLQFAIQAFTLDFGKTIASKIQEIARKENEPSVRIDLESERDVEELRAILPQSTPTRVDSRSSEEGGSPDLAGIVAFSPAITSTPVAADVKEKNIPSPADSGFADSPSSSANSSAEEREVSPLPVEQENIVVAVEETTTIPSPVNFGFADRPSSSANSSAVELDSTEEREASPLPIVQGNTVVAVEETTTIKPLKFSRMRVPKLTSQATDLFEIYKNVSQIFLNIPGVSETNITEMTAFISKIETSHTKSMGTLVARHISTAKQTLTDNKLYDFDTKGLNKLLEENKAALAYLKENKDDIQPTRKAMKEHSDLLTKYIAANKSVLDKHTLAELKDEVKKINKSAHAITQIGKYMTRVNNNIKKIKAALEKAKAFKQERKKRAAGTRRVGAIPSLNSPSGLGKSNKAADARAKSVKAKIERKIAEEKVENMARVKPKNVRAKTTVIKPTARRLR